MQLSKNIRICCWSVVKGKKSFQLLASFIFSDLFWSFSSPEKLQTSLGWCWHHLELNQPQFKSGLTIMLCGYSKPSSRVTSLNYILVFCFLRIHCQGQNGAQGLPILVRRCSLGWQWKTTLVVNAGASDLSQSVSSPSLPLGENLVPILRGFWPKLYSFIWYMSSLRHLQAPRPGQYFSLL